MILSEGLYLKSADVFYMLALFFCSLSPYNPLACGDQKIYKDKKNILYCTRIDWLSENYCYILNNSQDVILTWNNNLNRIQIVVNLSFTYKKNTCFMLIINIQTIFCSILVSAKHFGRNLECYFSVRLFLFHWHNVCYSLVL